MTTQKSIERLARFCGYPVTKARTQGWGSAPKGTMFIDVSEHVQKVLGPGGWDPFTRLDDAMMVAEKINRLDDNENGLELHWSITATYKATFGGFGHTPGRSAAEAITLAALAYLDAVEKKNE